MMKQIKDIEMRREMDAAIHNNDASHSYTFFRLGKGYFCNVLIMVKREIGERNWENEKYKG